MLVLRAVQLKAFRLDVTRRNLDSSIRRIATVARREYDPHKASRLIENIEARYDLTTELDMRDRQRIHCELREGVALWKVEKAERTS